MMIKFPFRFDARTYQEEWFRAFFYEGYKHLMLVCHRRAGKDKTCINLLLGAACQRVATYFYLFPQTNQARRVIWRGMDGSGMRFLDHIPPEIINKTNNSDMSVELINGSIIQMGGSNNFDALMGSNPAGIVYSEHSLHNPLARQYLSPILVENGGWEIINTTPRGKNHTYKLYQMALEDPRWFVRKLSIDDTRKSNGDYVITHAQIDDERRSGMPEELIRQEFFCDFNIGIHGAYYTREMEQMEYEGRICNFEVENRYPVFTLWDIGVSDPTCIIFVQQRGSSLDIIDYHESTDRGIDYYARLLREKAHLNNWTYRYHFAPHDINKREWGSSARSALNLAREQGIHFLITPNVGIDNGIQAARALFPHIRIHATNCAPLVDILREYRREWDEENKTFKKVPFHNWASHGADAYRYLAVVWREEFTKKEGSQPRTYSTDSFLPSQPGPGPKSVDMSYTLRAGPP
jgi:phage terminase large subunit